MDSYITGEFSGETPKASTSGLWDFSQPADPVSNPPRSAGEEARIQIGKLPGDLVPARPLSADYDGIVVGRHVDLAVFLSNAPGLLLRIPGKGAMYHQIQPMGPQQFQA